MRRRPPIAHMAYRERCGKRRASSAKCAGIGASDAHAAARDFVRKADPLARNTEDAVLRRWVRKRRIRDHAACFARRRTQRQPCEAARHASIVRDDHISAQEHSHDEPFAQCRIRLDLVVQQANQQLRALGVSNENDRPSAIVVRKILMPALHHACVGDLLIPLLVVVVVQQRGERQLAIHRRPHVAHARERRPLRECNVALRRLHVEIGVVDGLTAYGRIDIETVERRGGSLPPVRNPHRFS